LIYLKKISSLLLWPYAFILRVRHFLFDKGFLKSESFDLPSISVGNLALGGTGKSPFTIYLVELLLKKGLKVAVLSRGYGRTTKGLVHAKSETHASEIGDEPYMYFTRLKGIEIIVAERRVDGMNYIKNNLTDVNVVILDDAYQHRAVNPSVELLLTEERLPFWKDHLFPLGYLRDLRSAASRSDAIIITKAVNFKTELPNFLYNKPKFYLETQYQKPYLVNGKQLNSFRFICFSGLAKNTPFAAHISEEFTLVKQYSFKDHHSYSKGDLLKIINHCNAQSIPTGVITTEKDLARLTPEMLELFSETSLYALPIAVKPRNEDLLLEFLLERVNF